MFANKVVKCEHDALYIPLRAHKIIATKNC